MPPRGRSAAVAPSLRAAWPYAALLTAGILLPFTGNDYWGIIATRAAIYWVLVAGLNLVVGFAGQLAIGYVGLLTLGAYTTAVLCARTSIGMVPALVAAGAVGAGFGVLVGLPALRLRTFYFAMGTLGFATIVTQVALAWTDVTGGGVGVPGPVLPKPFDTPWGFYAACLALAALCTWMTANIAASRFGRAFVAIRDAEVAAEVCGIGKPRMFVLVFLFSGATAGVAGGLFADLQTYITPDAFTFDLSVLFFIAILIGGRGSILGPLLGTLLLTALPEVAAPLVAWSTFLYAALLLLIVLLIPGGIASLLDWRNRRPLERNRSIVPHPDLLGALLTERHRAPPLAMRDVELSFDGVRAIDGLSLTLHTGEVHGLIGPNGSGKTTTLNVICGFAQPQRGTVMLGEAVLPAGAPQSRAQSGIARTFQTPRLVGEASGDRQRHDRRHRHRAREFRGSGALARPPPPRRARARPPRDHCAANASGWRRWPRCAATGCNTASSASSKSPAHSCWRPTFCSSTSPRPGSRARRSRISAG